MYSTQKCFHEPATLKSLGFYCMLVEHQGYAITTSKSEWKYAWEDMELASWEIQRKVQLHLRTWFIEMVATLLDFYQLWTPGEQFTAILGIFW